MLDATSISAPTPYATTSDFCRIFDQQKGELYLLSFLLTANRARAEQCFISGLEDSVKGNSVFKEWAHSWARRAIIQCAVRAINPRPTHQSFPSNSNNIDNPFPLEMGEFAAILDLSPFERFVYVMVVLERYSIQDCSVLLGYSRRDVVEARLRALQQIGSETEVNLAQQLSVG